jgi:hypothetical protein
MLINVVQISRIYITRATCLVHFILHCWAKNMTHDAP